MSFTRKGFAKSPLATRSKSSLWLLLRRMFAAPFTSAFNTLWSLAQYNPRFSRLPLKETSWCVPFQSGILSLSRTLALDV